jgi:thiol-disulfide isomerase/thioredoxin
MKKKIFLSLCLMASLFAKGQEQFTKTFDINVKHMRLDSVLERLCRTQTDLSISTLPEMQSFFITMDLKNVTLDQAMDKLFTLQPFFKYYCVTDKKRFNRLEVTPEKLASRYFNYYKEAPVYHIGDQLPDSVFAVHNYPRTELGLKDIKKKLIILDMWGVNCTGCILGLPDMESLQERFKDQVQIIVTTKDSWQAVEQLKKRVDLVKNSTLPFITGENTLASMFAYDGLPHMIWLDGDGKVIYNTPKPIASAKYISDFLAGKRMDIRETKDTIIEDDMISEPVSKTMSLIHHGDFAVSSYLAPHNEDRYSYFSYSLARNDDTARYKMVRLFPADFNTLYKIAAGLDDDAQVAYSNTRIIKNFKDPGQYAPDEVENKNEFDYQLLTKRKEITRNQFFRLMQRELDAYFKVESSLQNRALPCYVLKRTGNTAKLRPGAPKLQLGIKGHILTTNYCALDRVLWFINRKRVDHIPLVDETGLDPKLKIALAMNVDFDGRLAAVRRSLAPYGLTVTKESRKMSCIVIDDAKFTTLATLDR